MPLAGVLLSARPIADWVRPSAFSLTVDIKVSREMGGRVRAMKWGSAKEEIKMGEKQVAHRAGVQRGEPRQVGQSGLMAVVVVPPSCFSGCPSPPFYCYDRTL